MMGYTIAICGSVVTSTLLMTRSCFDYQADLDIWTLKPYLHLFPNFPFNRVMYVIVDACGFDGCFTRFEDLTDEMWGCIAMIYVDSVWIMIVALYLQQVIPQQYGVPKHPLFFCENLIKILSPKLHGALFVDESKLATYKDDGELLNEDDDCKAERKFIQ